MKNLLGLLSVLTMLLVGVSACNDSIDGPHGQDEEGRDAKVTDYYYYSHGEEKVYLSLNTKYAFLSVKEPQLPANIAQRGINATEFHSDNGDKYQYKGAFGTHRYYTRLNIEKKLSEKEYFELLSDIKRQNKDAIIAPYFWLGKYEVGLFTSFSVKLKEEKDTDILEKMAEQTGCRIIAQNASMPSWFDLSVTEASELNTLECVSFFYDSGLFEAAEPGFVPVGVIDISN